MHGEMIKTKTVSLGFHGVLLRNQVTWAVAPCGWVIEPDDSKKRSALLFRVVSRYVAPKRN